MLSDLDFLNRPIVMITGFGPFVDHPVNASWEAVKLLDKEEIENEHKCELVLIEIPVTYENVNEFVPALWDTHTPKLMIHVGVSNIARAMTIEMQAHKKGYQRKDYFDKCPADYVCPADGAIRIHTKLDVERICKEFNETNPEDDIKTVSSKDAGRYLCEYIYYTSLAVDNTRTLFIHVPDTDIYSSEQTARGIRRILDLCLQQLHEAEVTDNVADSLKNTNLGDAERELKEVTHNKI